MKKLELNQFNTTFRLEGNTQTRSLTVKEVVVKSNESNDLKMNVIDEKDITIFSLPLNESGETAVDRKFVFYDHLSINIEAGQPDTPFTVEVHYELS